MSGRIGEEPGHQEGVNDLEDAAFDQEWGENEDDPALIGAKSGTSRAPAAPKKAPKARKTAPKTSKDRPLQDPPFQIHRFDTLQKSYMWIAEWSGRKPPGPVEIRDAYGPGRYTVKDASKAEQRWRIGANPAAAAEPSEGFADEPEPFQSPPPPQVAPPAHDPHARAYQPYTAAGYGPSPPHPQTYAPSPHAADPQLLGTFYRLDAAIQQISADQRRLQDELRSVTYELQQVPARVAERVSSAISDAVDPYDQMSKLWEMSRNMADGVGPGEDKGPGMAEIVGALAGALGPGAAAMAAPPQPAPPAIAPPQPPEQPPGDLPGMTDAIKAEIEVSAKERGITYEQAIELAKRQGWDAAQLLTIARSTAAPPSPASTQ